MACFTYSTSDLFHPESLYQLLRGPLPGVVQAKGYFWIAAQPKWAIAFSLTGSSMRFTPFGRDGVEAPWAAPAGVPSDRAPLHRQQQPPPDEATQALIFIGADIDRPALTTALEACLLRHRCGAWQQAPKA
jgi:G3E family GTPase